MPARADTRSQLGAQAERLVEDYLCSRGLRLVQRNYLCPLGEIDLIMQERDTLVFVEVRSRRYSHFGTAVESVSRSKQAKLRRSAEFYIQQHTSARFGALRFDVVGVDTGKSTPDIDWIPNAF